MKRRKPLVTNEAAEHNHTRQNRMHGMDSPKRRIAKRHVEL